mmetsp:Transcript_19904/g.46684  ORF Transcript_19904/g.46684 Transcript_19904/m.46684 type:complete len:367 (+) Transcript_19904:519-1619(+)
MLLDAVDSHQLAPEVAPQVHLEGPGPVGRTLVVVVNTVVVRLVLVVLQLPVIEVRDAAVVVVAEDDAEVVAAVVRVVLLLEVGVVQPVLGIVGADGADGRQAVVLLVGPAALDENVQHQHDEDREHGHQRPPHERDGPAVSVHLGFAGLDPRLDVGGIFQVVPDLIPAREVRIVRDLGGAQKGRLVVTAGRVEDQHAFAFVFFPALPPALDLGRQFGTVNEVFQVPDDVREGRPVLVPGDGADVGPPHVGLVELTVLGFGIPLQLAAPAEEGDLLKLPRLDGHLDDPGRSVDGEIEAADALGNIGIDQVLLGHLPEEHLLDHGDGRVLGSQTGRVTGWVADDGDGGVVSVGALSLVPLGGPDVHVK